MQPVQHGPQIHHVHGVAYYKQNDGVSEKSAIGITNATESEQKIEKTVETTKMPEKMIEALTLNATEKAIERK